MVSSTLANAPTQYEPDIGTTVKPDPTPGYIYITQEDDLHHFCWRPRSALYTNPTIDLLMFPTDATFQPYRPANAKSAIAGRIYVLKFSSSSVRHLFWLQSSGKSGEPSEFSARDLKIGEIVNSILQGEEVDVRGELQNLPSGEDGSDSGDDDEDTAMEDADGPGSRTTGRQAAASGGAGANATGGDVREEGGRSRDGGADGGRA